MDTITAQVQQYMNDDARCFLDWYRAYRKLEGFPGEPVAALPTLDEIREAFSEWVQLSRDRLFNLICVEWDYPARRKDEKFQEKVTLAVALTEFLSGAFGIPSPATTAVLLVQVGLDEFCDS